MCSCGITNHLFIVVLLCIVSVLRFGLCDDKYLNPEWVDTHAWAGHKPRTNNQAQQIDECRMVGNAIGDSADLETSYRKLVTFFFDRDNFKVCAHFKLLVLWPTNVISYGSFNCYFRDI